MRLNQLSVAVCMYRSLWMKLLLSVCLYHFHLRFCIQDGWLYRLCACRGLAWKYSPHCTLLRLRGLPMSHLLEKVSTRCKSRVKARIYAASHKPQYCWWAPWVLLLLAASLTHGHVLNFVSTVIYQLISDDYVSPVQSTSVQWLVTPASTCMHWQKFAVVFVNVWGNTPLEHQTSSLVIVQYTYRVLQNLCNTA